MLGPQENDQSPYSMNFHCSKNVPYSGSDWAVFGTTRHPGTERTQNRIRTGYGFINGFPYRQFPSINSEVLVGNSKFRWISDKGNYVMALLRAPAQQAVAGAAACAKNG